MENNEKICNKCNGALGTSSKFCPNCGNSVETEQSQPTVSVESVQQASPSVEYVSTPSPEQVGGVNTSGEKPTKKSGSKVAIIAIVALIAVAGVAFAATTLLGSPTAKVAAAVLKTVEPVKKSGEIVKEIPAFSELLNSDKAVESEFMVNFEGMGENTAMSGYYDDMINMFVGMGIGAKYQFDNETKNGNVEFDFYQNDESFLGAELFFDEDKAVLQSQAFLGENAYGVRLGEETPTEPIAYELSEIKRVIVMYADMLKTYPEIQKATTEITMNHFDRLLPLFLFEEAEGEADTYIATINHIEVLEIFKSYINEIYANEMFKSYLIDSMLMSDPYADELFYETLMQTSLEQFNASLDMVIAGEYEDVKIHDFVIKTKIADGFISNMSVNIKVEDTYFEEVVEISLIADITEANENNVKSNWSFRLNSEDLVTGKFDVMNENDVYSTLIEINSLADIEINIIIEGKYDASSKKYSGTVSATDRYSVVAMNVEGVVESTEKMTFDKISVETYDGYQQVDINLSGHMSLKEISELNEFTGTVNYIEELTEDDVYAIMDEIYTNLFTNVAPFLGM